MESHPMLQSILSQFPLNPSIIQSLAGNLTSQEKDPWPVSIPSSGETSGYYAADLSQLEALEKLQSLKFKDLETKWINNEAMQLITSFGKDFFIFYDGLDCSSRSSFNWRAKRQDFQVTTSPKVGKLQGVKRCKKL